jgi:hypothetical protein
VLGATSEWFLKCRLKGRSWLLGKA